MFKPKKIDPLLLKLNRMNSKEYAAVNRPNVNMMINGRCSRCGSCCSNQLPMAGEEITELRQVVKERRLEPISHLPEAMQMLANRPDELICPFLDHKRRCTIYDKRPLVCQIFRCDMGSVALAIALAKQVGEQRVQLYTVVDLRAVLWA